MGWPSFAGVMSPRLGLDVTIHRDRYDETGLREKVEAYDRRREAVQPYKSQRYPEKFGRSESYGWSEDKVRQYSVPERADFGAFVRKRGFRLD
jgi:nitroreductase/FMN reductase [NAD(P)H]